MLWKLKSIISTCGIHKVSFDGLPFFYLATCPGKFNIVVILLIYLLLYPTCINGTQCDLEIDLYESHGRGCTCLE